jgi:cytochrome P450
VAGSAFEASIGTTSGTLLWFIVAMILYPETQKQAQAEIDSFLGDTGDMPSLSHMKNLPYCVALSKEVMRWMPVAPGAFPHYSDADDEYKGFHIPKHTLIVPHVWAIHRDPSLYPDPLTFEPGRFMGKGNNDDSPDALTGGHFGFG